MSLQWDQSKVGTPALYYLQIDGDSYYRGKKGDGAVNLVDSPRKAFKMPYGRAFGIGKGLEGKGHDVEILIY